MYPFDKPEFNAEYIRELSKKVIDIKKTQHTPKFIDFLKNKMIEAVDRGIYHIEEYVFRSGPTEYVDREILKEHFEKLGFYVILTDYTIYIDWMERSKNE